MEYDEGDEGPATRRVAIHTADGQVDVALPATVPVGLLLPPLCDLVDATLGREPGSAPLPRYLSPIGRPPLDGSKTLPENGIDEGDLLLLVTAPARNTTPPPVDTATCVATVIAASTRPWTPGRSRATAMLAAVALSGLAGFLAVPGPPGAWHLLLAASGAGATAAVAGRVAVVCRTVFAALAVGCALVAVSALCGSAFGDDPRAAGLVLATGSIGVLVSAGRLTLMLSGLSAMAIRDLDPAESSPPEVSATVVSTFHALALASASTAALGVVLAAVARPRPSGLALITVVGAALLLRGRNQRGSPLQPALVCAGMACAAVVLVAARELHPASATVLSLLTCAIGAAALWCGRQAPQRIRSPMMVRLAAGAEYAVLASIIPLACLALGFFDTVRAVSSR